MSGKEAQIANSEVSAFIVRMASGCCGLGRAAMGLPNLVLASIAILGGGLIPKIHLLAHL
jgi:hypothetical protein